MMGKKNNYNDNKQINNYWLQVKYNNDDRKWKINET